MTTYSPTARTLTLPSLPSLSAFGHLSSSSHSNSRATSLLSLSHNGNSESFSESSLSPGSSYASPVNSPTCDYTRNQLEVADETGAVATASPVTSEDAPMRPSLLARPNLQSVLVPLRHSLASYKSFLKQKVGQLENTMWTLSISGSVFDDPLQPPKHCYKSQPEPQSVEGHELPVSQPEPTASQRRREEGEEEQHDEDNNETHELDIEAVCQQSERREL